MPADQNINSFDELKVALDSALRNGAASPEAVDYLMERFEVLCMDIDNVFLAISANDIKEYYPNLSLDEALEVRDNANENLWNSGGYDDINDTAWDQRNVWRGRRVRYGKRQARHGRHPKVDATSVP